MRSDVCTVIPFPTKQRIGKIRRAAEVLADRHGKGAEQYWRQVAGGMRSQMVAAGISPEMIDAQLRDFFDAVQHEMVRQSYGDRSGGAA